MYRWDPETWVGATRFERLHTLTYFNLHRGSVAVRYDMLWDQADSEYVHGMPRMVDVSAALEDPGERLIQKLK